jgi:hypothetical protein
MISISFLRLFVENLLTMVIVSCESFAVLPEGLELPKPFEICSVKRELIDKVPGSGHGMASTRPTWAISSRHDIDQCHV